MLVPGSAQVSFGRGVFLLNKKKRKTQWDSNLQSPGVSGNVLGGMQPPETKKAIA